MSSSGEVVPAESGPLDFCHMESSELWEGTPPERVARTIDLLLTAYRRHHVAPLIEVYEELSQVQGRVRPDEVDSDTRSHFCTVASVAESALPSTARTFVVGDLAPSGFDATGDAAVLHGNCVIRGLCRSVAPLDVDEMELWGEGEFHVEGSMRNGRLHGRCLVRSMTRPACSVDTFFEDGVPHGRAMVRCPRGSYRGDTLGGHLSGKCRLVLEGCLLYEGGVMNGLPHGFGVLEWGRANHYRGHWHLGTPHGDGVVDSAVYVRHTGGVLVRVCSLAKKCTEDLRVEVLALRNTLSMWERCDGAEGMGDMSPPPSENANLACKICMSREVRYASQPCGHLIWCEHCVVRCVPDICAICRQRCTATQRIYI